MKESMFQFSDPKLRSLQFNVNEHFSKESYSGFTFKNDVSKAILIENKEAIVSLKLCIGETSEKYPFNIELEIYAKFICDEEAMFQQLIDTNAPAMLLSYARPIISLVTSQSGYPAFNLPFMNFTKDEKES